MFILNACISVPKVPMATPDEDATAKNFIPPPDKALIYIIDPENTHIGPFEGYSLSPFLNKTMVGELNSGSFSMIDVPPGKYRLSFSSNLYLENLAALLLDLDAGKLYFIKVYLSGGLMGPTIHVEQLNEEEGKLLVLQNKRVQARGSFVQQSR